MRSQAWRWCAAVAIVVCAACNTVKVRVMSEEGGTSGSYHLFFLTEREKDTFEQLKAQDDTLDHWINYASWRPNELLGSIASERSRSGMFNEAEVNPILVEGDEGIARAKWFLLIVTGGGEKLSAQNHLLKRRKKLVAWPYWSTGVLTVSKEEIRIGRPNLTGHSGAADGGGGGQAKENQ